MFRKIMRSPAVGGERGSAVSLAYCIELGASAIMLSSPEEDIDGKGRGARKPVVLGEKKPSPGSGDPGASRTKT